MLQTAEREIAERGCHLARLSVIAINIAAQWFYAKIEMTMAVRTA